MIYRKVEVGISAQTFLNRNRGSKVSTFENKNFEITTPTSRGHNHQIEHPKAFKNRYRNRIY